MTDIIMTRDEVEQTRSDRPDHYHRLRASHLALLTRVEALEAALRASGEDPDNLPDTYMVPMSAPPSPQATERQRAFLHNLAGQLGMGGTTVDLWSQEHAGKAVGDMNRHEIALLIEQLQRTPREEVTAWIAKTRAARTLQAIGDLARGLAAEGKPQDSEQDRT